MFDMFINSVTLFLQGRLFQDLGAVVRQAAIGIVIAAVIIILLAQIGLPLWVGVAIASLISGAVQPFLFKDLKYA